MVCKYGCSLSNTLLLLGRERWEEEKREGRKGWEGEREKERERERGERERERERERETLY